MHVRGPKIGHARPVALVHLAATVLHQRPGGIPAPLGAIMLPGDVPASGRPSDWYSRSNGRWSC
jgi:hypothetical protein